MEIYQFLVNDSTVYWLSCQTSQTAQKYNVQKNYTQRNEKVHSHKRKSLFIPIRLHSITISGVIDYILEALSTSSSLEKKKKKLQEEKWKGKRGGKEEKKKKGMERVRAEEGETDVEEKKKQNRGE